MKRLERLYDEEPGEQFPDPNDPPDEPVEAPINPPEEKELPDKP